MRRHGRTLFITTDGMCLSKKGETLLLTRRHQPQVRVPIHLIDDVICMARVSLTPYAMNLCAVRGIPITLLSNGGRLLARIIGVQRGNVQVRRGQFQTAESPEESARLASRFISCKIANARSLLMRSDRQRKDSDDTSVLAAIRRLGRLIRQLNETETISQSHLSFSADPASSPADQIAVRERGWKKSTFGSITLERLRSIEGDAAKRYYRVFNRLITVSDPFFSFEHRTRRPPKDPVNALLSYAYTFLALDVQAACEAVGLDPQVGFLHADRSGRPSLALDLMEELRPILADRLVLSLINRRQIGSQHFVTRSDGGILLNEAGRIIFCQTRHKRREETVRHPFLNEAVPYGCIPFIQAKLLAKTFRREIPNYPGLVLK